jgi:hypothetical protein
MLLPMSRARMMLNPRIGLVGLGIVAVVGAALWWQLASPLTKTALLQPKLDNEVPKFLSLPPDLPGTVATLNAMGARLYSVEQADHCLFHKFKTPQTIYLFADDGWRGGTICVVPAGGEVAEIYWRFQVGAP